MYKFVDNSDKFKDDLEFFWYLDDFSRSEFAKSQMSNPPNYMIMEKVSFRGILLLRVKKNMNRYFLL